MSQISNGMKSHNSQYTRLLNITNYDELKLLLAKSDNFPNWEIFQKGFLFFLMTLTSMHRWNHLKSCFLPIYFHVFLRYFYSTV